MDGLPNEGFFFIEHGEVKVTSADDPTEAITGSLDSQDNNAVAVRITDERCLILLKMDSVLSATLRSQLKARYPDKAVQTVDMTDFAADKIQPTLPSDGVLDEPEEPVE